MQYLQEVLDSIRYLDERVKELADKTLAIDTIMGQLDGLPIQEIMYRMDNLRVDWRHCNGQKSTLGFITLASYNII